MMLAHNTYPSRTQQHQQPQQPYPYYHGQQQHHQHQHPQQQQQFSQQFQPGNFAASDSAAFSATLDNIPTAAAALAATQRYHHSRSATPNSQGLNLMSSDSWMVHGQHTPRQTQQRFGHQRDSSLSSVGSNTPASPYNANTTNPQIAVTDAVGDSLHDMATASENNYTFGLTKPMTISEAFYPHALGPLQGHGGGGMSGHHDIMGDMSTTDGLPALTGSQQPRQGRLAPMDMPAPGISTRSRPVSVASSIGGDSPATPSFHEHEDDHRRAKNASATGADMPKLDRTLTDVYSDELYSPTFAITSASPSPQTHLALSPGNDLFTQRLQTANNRHLFAVHSPVSTDSRGHSPFRQGSPYASALNEFSKVGTNHARLESAQQLRERRKAEEDAKQLQQQMARNSQQGQQQQQQQSTPTTISPKDAVLDFSEADIDSNFPLFPSQETNTYGLVQSNGGGGMNRITSQQQSASPFHSIPSTPMRGEFNFSMPTQIPQQYPFVSRQQSQPQQRPQQLTPSASTFSRMSSAEASNTDGGSSIDGRAQRPDRTSADGGTYTCTYHGCTLRFETPALLQKHKREGHRQAGAFNHVRGSTSATSAPGSGLSESIVANSQAGPHRCDRINPSTGKPCNTVFSRPYDLTRHEDTIHNARKQKVRCGLCTEEKTFSRADALTRHYRVCHPDAELPGKHRRRGGTMGV